VVYVIWSDPAIDNVRQIAAFIAKDAPQRAATFAKELFEAPRRLGQFPLSGEEVPEFRQEDIRQIFHGAYRIIYVVRKGACWIAACIHSSRDLASAIDPSGWKFERLP
jgi:toxin ParE1/3/4